MQSEYDLVILGGGAAGSEAAFSVADGGRTSILLVESHHFGGTCTNHGCVPTKALVKAARTARVLRTASEFGFDPVEPRFEWSRVIARANRVRDHMLRFGSTPFSEAGVEVAFPAEARLTGNHELLVDGHRIRAGAVLLATGLEALVPPIPGLVESGYLDNESVLELKALPGRMAVIGGGPIGCEFAQVFARFGVEVTIIEGAERLLAVEEPETGDALRQAFEAEGITVRAASRVARVERSGAARLLHLEDGSRVEVDEILVAVGRSLDADKLGLDLVGVEWSPHGIKVDSHLRTSVEWIHAAGDVVGGLLFTHTASAMGPIAARNALGRGEPEAYQPRIVPRVTFTDPEAASVGLSERQAREAGHQVRIGIANVKDAEKAEIDGETIGQVKVVAGLDGQMLGCSMVASGAGDMIHEAVAIMAGRVPVKMVAAEMHAYPTLSELTRSALAEAAG